MTAEEPATVVMDAFDALAIPYMIVGSYSSNYYGIPRSTQDADFVAQLGETPIAAVSDLLRSAYRLDPQMGFETVTGTIRYRFQHLSLPFLVELFLLSDDPHDQERFARRCRVHVFGRDAFLPTAEDVIITKLRWAVGGGRNKDKDDVRNVVALRSAKLDWDYVNRWCDRHGTSDALESIRQSLGMK